MKKLFKIIAATIIAALGIYCAHLGSSALIQGVGYVQIVGCVALIGFGIGLVFIAWSLFRGYSVKDILDILLIGLFP